MNSADLMKMGVAAAALFAAYKFGGAWGKSAAVAIGSVAIAKRLPYLGDVL
jgi:hypothetical protein